MAITNGYATLAEVKAKLDIQTATTTYDSMLENIVEAVSRKFDLELGRNFFATAETRYYTAEDADRLRVDDIVRGSTITLKTISANAAGTRTYGYTWAAGDYDAEPFNVPPGLATWPYTALRINPQGRYAFPSDAKGVEIAVAGTGYGFGFCQTGSHPEPLTEGCSLMAQRIFKRKDAPLGVAGSPDSGMIRIARIDEDVWWMIEKFRRFEVLAVAA